MADFFRLQPLDLDLDAVAQLSPEGEVVINAVRPPELHFYAYIDEMELEEGRGRTRRLQMLLYCIRAEWFDALPDDLAGMPPLNTIAEVAQSCAVEVVWRYAEFQKVSSFAQGRGEAFHLDFESVHLSEGWWLDVGLSNNLQNGYPVTVYPPAEGSTDPATIGNTPREFAASLCWVARVRPPSRLAKLHRFSHTNR